MKPIAEQHPTDAKLLAHLDEPEPGIAAHLAWCSECRARTEQLVRLEGQLASKLGQSPCPTSLELGEFHLRVLPPEREAYVARHLAECARCRREIALLAEFQAQVPLEPEPSLWDRLREGVRILWAQQVSHATTATLAPAYRGEEAPPPTIYEVEQVRLIVEMDVDPMRPGHFVVTGLVAGMGDLGGAEVQLWLGGEPAGRTLVGELGDFSLEGLPAGSYTLVLAMADAQIHVRDLAVGA